MQGHIFLQICQYCSLETIFFLLLEKQCSVILCMHLRRVTVCKYIQLTKVQTSASVGHDILKHLQYSLAQIVQVSGSLLELCKTNPQKKIIHAIGVLTIVV